MDEYIRVYVKYSANHFSAEEFSIEKLISLSLNFPNITPDELKNEDIQFHTHSTGLIVTHRYSNKIIVEDFWINNTKKYIRIRVVDNSDVIVECSDTWDENDRYMWKWYEMKILLDKYVINL